MERRYTLLDVFTSKGRGGNPLAVLTEAEGLDTEAMQAIARKLKLSETVFVLPPEHEMHTAAIRIFTPESELPFAGHPTIGTSVCLALKRIWPKMGDPCDALAVLEVQAGILRVAVKPAGEAAAFAEFDVPVLPEEIGEAAPDDRLAAALGLAPTEIGFENYHARYFSAGVPFTFVPVDGLEAIGRARVVEEFWSEAFGGGHASAYLYCRDTVLHKAGFHARCFAPSMGIAEDPATGSAVAALAGAINMFDAPPEGNHSVLVEQGVEMGRPCEIFLDFEVVNRNLRSVRIGGYASLIREDTVTL